MFDDWYETPAGRADEPRELKVRLPLWMHMKLHGIKLLCDQNLSETTERALRYWFQAVERGDIAPDDPCEEDVDPCDEDVTSSEAQARDDAR